MINEHTLFLGLWLGTGGGGQLFGLLGVQLAKRRLRVSPIGVPALAEEELVAA
jgi:hypothetical protein